MTNRSLVASVLALSLILAACGGSAASPAASSGSSAPPAATAEPAATAGPTEQPAATQAATSDIGSNGGPLNDLASTLPATAGGVTFERAGYDGSQLGPYAAMAGIDSDTLSGVLTENGKTLADVNFAIATSAGDAGGGLVYALQVEGVSPDTMMTALGFDSGSLTKSKIGGKTVYASGGGGFGVTVYPKDDTVYVIFLTSDDLTKAILEQLP